VAERLNSIAEECMVNPGSGHVPAEEALDRSKEFRIAPPGSSECHARPGVERISRILLGRARCCQTWPIF
jgi:hypothetical protein